MAIEEILDQIKDFADHAHGDQTRKYTPDRYIVHPVRVMNTCKEYSNDITILAAALLHDVLEDTPVTKSEMRNFLLRLMDETQTGKTVKLVEELTDVYIKKDYPQWNRRKRKDKEAERLSAISPDAQTIKYADIIDNSVEIVDHDFEFARVYLHEGRAILKKINKGDQRLYQRAVETVNKGIQQLEEKKK
jgi:(p)ppGpp synthase/HD superfamily hydrolase